MKLESKFGFGDEVKDLITNTVGIVVALDFWMNGCKRVGIQGKQGKDLDKYPDIFWVDSYQLEITEKNAIKLGKHKPTEGPKPSYTHNTSLK